MKKFYLTTAINDLNDGPHIGHMYEGIVADVLARHRRDGR
jgi:methionyl-tRNA synthetase